MVAHPMPNFGSNFKRRPTPVIFLRSTLFITTQWSSTAARRLPRKCPHGPPPLSLLLPLSPLRDVIATVSLSACLIVESMSTTQLKCSSLHHTRRGKLAKHSTSESLTHSAPSLLPFPLEDNSEVHPYYEVQTPSPRESAWRCDAEHSPNPPFLLTFSLIY